MADQFSTPASKFHPMDQFTVKRIGPIPPDPPADLSAEFLAFCVGMTDAVPAEFSDPEERLQAHFLLEHVYRNADAGRAEKILMNRKAGYALALDSAANAAGEIVSLPIDEMLVRVVANMEQQLACLRALGELG